MASRLSLMQARFQQKQMQEREEKLLRLYENRQQRAIERVNRGSAGSDTSVGSLTGANMTNHGGKVRQMFDERRQKAGIDRSYPLEPLGSKRTGNGLESRAVNGKKAPTKAVNRNAAVQGRNGKPTIGRQQAASKVYYDFDGPEYYQENGYNDNNGNKSYKNQTIESLMHNSHISDSIQDESFPEYGIDDDLDEPVTTSIVNVKLANVGGILPSQNEKLAKSSVERIVTMNPGGPVGKKPIPHAKTVAKASLKKPADRRAASESPSQPPNRIRSPEMMQQRTKGGKEPQQRPQSSRSNKSPQPILRAPSESRPARSPKGPPAAVARDDLDSCRYCSRRFAADRLQLHEDICSKTSKKKRKTYDATKHRVQGTELEPFARKAVAKTSSKASSKASQGTVKSDWRRKHEDFISAIRSAKQAQAYVAKGGKLTDLPPPPPSYNPDYVTCPHCDRRFNQQAADRHIPKCVNYQFNKPKPATKPSSRAR